MQFCLVVLAGLFDVSADQGSVLVDFVTILSRNDQGRSLFDLEGVGHVFVGGNIDDAVGDARTVEEGLRHLAVGASRGGEEEEFGELRCEDVGFGLAGAVVAMLFFVLRRGDLVGLAHIEFLDLAGIPVLDWAVVAGDAGIDFGFASAVRALVLLAGDVSMLGADGIGRRHGVIGELVVEGDLANELHAGFPIREALTQEGMEDGAGGVEGLELVFDVEGGEDVVGEANRKMAGVGVIGGLAGAGSGDDVWIALLVVLGKAEGGGFGWGGLEVIEVAILFLIVREAFSHVVEDLGSEVLGFFVGEVFADPAGIQAGFVHADQSDGGEVVVEGAEVMLGVWIQPSVQQFGDGLSLDAERTGGDVHQTIEPVVEVLLVSGEIGKARHVEGNDADGTGGFAASEEASGFLPEFAEVEAETAAHGAHVGWLHIGVDVVGEVRGAVFRGHGEEKLVVLGRGPVEIASDGIGWDRILESTSVGVAFDHGFDEGAVDHSHLFFAIAIGEVHFLAADEGWKVDHVIRNGPVEGDVGERRLGAPTRWGVDAVDEGLDALLDLFVGEIIDLDEWSEVGVEGGERLSAGPFVLHDAEEVDHLVAKGHQVAGWGRGDFARDAAEAFLDQLLEGPTSAVAGKHGKIVDMDIGVAVSIGDFPVVDFGEPIVSGDGTGVGKDKATDGIGDGGILLNTPVGDAKVAVDDVLEVKVGVLDLAELGSLVAVIHIGFRDIDVSSLNQDDFDGILDLFDRDGVIFDLLVENGSDTQRKKLDDFARGILVLRGKSALNGAGNLFEIECS